MRRIAALHRAGRALLPSIAVLSMAIAAQSLGLGAGLDRRLHDAFLRSPAIAIPEPPASLPDVAIVAIDPRSLRALETWPWPRSTHGLALDRIVAAGARAVAFDIDFSSPSRAEEDARFARSLAASGRGVLAAFSQTEILPTGPQLEIVNTPIESLARSAAGLGSVTVPIDPDGVVREVPRNQSIAGSAVPSLARAALRLVAPERMREAIEARNAANDAAPVDYRRQRPEIPRIAYIDLLEDRFDPALVADRVVFIGATAAEFQDLWATPIDPALPGVMIQALAYRTAAAEAVGDATLRTAPALAVALAYALLALVLHPRRGRAHRMRGLLFVGSAAAVVGLGGLSLSHLGLAWPATIPLALVGVQYALGIEGLERHVRAIAVAHASSFEALARVGDVTSEGVDALDVATGPEGGLEIALRLLGDVVSARGVVLMRIGDAGQLDERRLEWRPESDTGGPLRLDPDSLDRVRRERRVVESADPDHAGALVVHAPLLAGASIVGVLVVFTRAGRALDALQRRTITTVAAQLALTAQNIQLIERLRATFESSIAAVAGAVEARDGYTDQHCRRLAAFSSLMGARLGLPAAEIRAMELGALLHDVGKIGIRDDVLNKPERLTSPERREMQRHPEIGAGIVGPVVGLEPTTLHCILHHHEAWDGSGYPRGLAGNDIPLAARIVSIVDVWDALSTARPYKPAFDQATVRELLRKGAGTQFDPALVELFFEVLEEQGEEMLALVARSSSSGVES